jgi:glycosyltransferase involved in cell wall biosynthesis
MTLEILQDKPKITIVIPCFGRPQRTKRLCEDLLQQDMNGWEAFFIGDSCPDFQNIIEEGYFETKSKQARANGNALIYSNLPNHYGGFGYEIRNRAKLLANGEYICFVDNDDRIKNDHLSTYYTSIVNTELDFAYFDTYINPTNQIRISELEFGKIGHAELVISTHFYKTIPPQNAEYGHDWKLISDMVSAGAKYRKIIIRPTYKVMGLGDLRETGID